jgi:hypothetical protein
MYAAVSHIVCVMRVRLIVFLILSLSWLSFFLMLLLIFSFFLSLIHSMILCIHYYFFHSILLHPHLAMCGLGGTLLVNHDDCETFALSLSRACVFFCFFFAAITMFDDETLNCRWYLYCSVFFFFWSINCWNFIIMVILLVMQLQSWIAMLLFFLYHLLAPCV